MAHHVRAGRTSVRLRSRHETRIAIRLVLLRESFQLFSLTICRRPEIVFETNISCDSVLSLRQKAGSSNFLFLAL
jgi:hypothetical protein